jgi:hypothetical protein
MQTADELPFLVKLLDDEDPTVQQRLAERFAHYPGDLSGQLAELGITLTPADQDRLSRLLAPARRRHVRNEWFVPHGNLDGTEPDWESFEFLLRLLSDLLHDGTSLRPHFFEAIDRVAEDARLHAADTSEEDLCAFLFGSGLFKANSQGYYDSRNADLLWIINQGKGNPIGLAVLAMLVGSRLGLEIWGCSFPGHFLAWIGSVPDALLVDCYHRGRLISLRDLRDKPGILSPEARIAIQRPCTLREILQRILTNLQFSFVQAHRDEEIELVGELLQSLDAKP